MERRIVETVGELVEELTKRPQGNEIALRHNHAVLCDFEIAVGDSKIFGETYIDMIQREDTMEKQLSTEELAALALRKERSDKGGRHRASRHGGFRVGQYNLAGRLEAEYASLIDAVENNTVGATYSGILDCCMGRAARHRGKIWRKEAGDE